NTALTTLEFGFGRWRVGGFNDASHLGPSTGFAADRAASGDPVLTFVRHGETDANVQELWQGQSDWGLNDVGRAQAARLAQWYEPGGPIYSSPLGRAHQTASALNGGSPVLVDGLKEISMGAWEGLHGEAIKAGWPDLWRRTFEEHEDLKRGGDGESVAELMERMRVTVDQLAGRRHDGRITVVSHGSAIRAFVVSVLGGGNEVFRSTGLLPNTGMANVVMTERGYRLADYGIAPHLD
ncbi:MAG: histidine phosphatase family protein, partial [Acidimicrobiia bacterium]|nr:histidine phosphatase family protein [Acidimicrobiia bacterium]